MARDAAVTSKPPNSAHIIAIGRPKPRILSSRMEFNPEMAPARIRTDAAGKAGKNLLLNSKGNIHGVITNSPRAKAKDNVVASLTTFEKKLICTLLLVSDATPGN